MKTHSSRPGKAGYISYFMVLSTCTVLTFLTFYTYERAMTMHTMQSSVQLRADYSEKEEAILRSMVAITPNRAIRAMQNSSNGSSTVRNPLRWQNICTESLAMANAATSIPSNLISTLNLTNHRIANSGDASLTSPNSIFRALNSETGYVSAGINRSLGAGYPPPLSSAHDDTNTRDPVYPIIASTKTYGTLAQSGVGLPVATYPNFNLLSYPNINFGYAKPGEPFVAKRNWWAFSLDLSANNFTQTSLSRPRRNIVMSIYEIPSQLAISADSFMALGNLESGEAWQNVNIDGGVFAGKAIVEGSTQLSTLASRRGMTLSQDSRVGGTQFVSNPFTPGLRETHQITTGQFFPVSLASESGRVAFVPINRGPDYFDRFAHSTESNAVSSTTWNNYSIGALQCAMQLDITQCVSAVNPTPTRLRFSYFRGGSRQSIDIDLLANTVNGLPPGYVLACNENESFNFGTSVVDVAYGKDGVFAFQNGVTGTITFNNARFGDPLVGVYKAGYFRPSYPFEVKTMPSGKVCLAIYPKRFKSFLTSINADSTAVNNSLVVNVDYKVSVDLRKPSIPCTDLDYGLIVQECADLSDFNRGFSLVTNLRTFIGDDFNVVPVAPPSGYTPPGDYYPPVSLFAPEKRFGVDVDPYAVNMSGQIGSLASENSVNPVRPIDSKTASGNAMTASRITVNLRPIRHPAELPPITMMNWLVVIEQMRSELLAN